MEKSLKNAFNISLVVHLLILAGIPAKQKQIVSIPLNIELMRVKPPPPEEVVKPKEEAVKEVKKTPKEKEEKKPEKKEPKKEEKNEPAKQQEVKPALIQASSNIMLEAKEFPFAYYLKILQNKIASNWEWPSETGILKSTIYFKILKDGSITELNVEKTSGDYLFDQASKRAVNLANPMIPLPEGYSENELGVYFEFKFNE